MIDLINNQQQETSPRFAILMENPSFELHTEQVQQEAREKQELGEMRSQHVDLDARISELSCEKIVDHSVIRHLRKQRLQLKEKLIYYDQTEYPDIIA